MLRDLSSGLVASDSTSLLGTSLVPTGPLMLPESTLHIPAGVVATGARVAIAGVTGTALAGGDSGACGDPADGELDAQFPPPLPNVPKPSA